jgi:hypothetical protein
MAKTRLLYEVVGADWSNKVIGVSFVQLIQMRCDDGWEPIGAAIRHPDPEKQFWWQTMVKRVRE